PAQDARRWALVGVAVLAAGLVAFTVDPRLGLGGLALFAAPLLIVVPECGVLLLTAMLPFDELSAFDAAGTLSFTRLVGIGVLCAWLVHVVARGRNVRLGSGGRWLAAYVAFAAVSLIWADDRTS